MAAALVCSFLADLYPCSWEESVDRLLNWSAYGWACWRFFSNSLTGYWFQIKYLSTPNGWIRWMLIWKSSCRKSQREKISIESFLLSDNIPWFGLGQSPWSWRSFSGEKKPKKKVWARMLSTKTMKWSLMTSNLLSRFPDSKLAAHSLLQEADSGDLDERLTYPGGNLHWNAGTGGKSGEKGYGLFMPTICKYSISNQNSSHQIKNL